MPYIELVKSGYKDCQQMQQLINYVISEPADIQDESKDRIPVQLSGGNYVFIGDASYIYDQMIHVKSIYNQLCGRFMQHLFISPSNYERDYINDEQLYIIAMQICNLFPDYQTLFSIHTSTGRSHIHLIINTVSFLDGKKIQINLYQIRQEIKALFALYVPAVELSGLAPQEYTCTTFDSMD